jgi:Zn-finger protein
MKKKIKKNLEITFIFISITTEKYYVHLALGESQFCYCTFKKIENNQAGSEES